MATPYQVRAAHIITHMINHMKKHVHVRDDVIVVRDKCLARRTMTMIRVQVRDNRYMYRRAM